MTGPVKQAFTDWTNANKNNGSGVSFVLTDGKSHSYTFLVKASTGQYVGSNGTDPTVYAFTSFANGAATTTWYLGSNPINTTLSTFPGFVTKGQRHEIGHPMGLTDQPGDCSNQTPGQSVMNYACSDSTATGRMYNDASNNLPSGIQSCDNSAVTSEKTFGGSGSGGASGDYSCYSPAPISCGPYSVECNSTYGWYCSNVCVTPEPDPCCEECYESCEDGQWVCTGSPIILDVFGTGFHLSDINNGVQFHVLPDRKLYQMSWPEATFRNGWLALDRNGDGKITDFTELFGNATPQPKSNHPNGYLALAVFDDPANGGNGNGFIDPGDAVFSHLRVWIDDNHNGISEPNELHTLQEAGVFKIDLDYFFSPYTDENGNEFRYKSKVWDRAGKEHDVCYDVFVKIGN